MRIRNAILVVDHGTLFRLVGKFQYSLTTLTTVLFRTKHIILLEVGFQVTVFLRLSVG